MSKTSQFVLNGSITIAPSAQISTPVRFALDFLLRDMEKVFGRKPGLCDDRDKADIIVDYHSGKDKNEILPESFSVLFEERNGTVRMLVTGSDDLGIVYGLLYVSREFLGVDPFWFWADKEPEKREEITIDAADFHSVPPEFRYRGWFVNDEVCLLGWTDVYPPPREVWLSVFEALLRCGGNMVIPGTDLPRDGIHCSLASEMGLWITNHHAEPLGAEMFLREHYDKEASYAKHPELYEKLWRDAAVRNKDKKMIWTLGMRGQGDMPFWDNDPAFKTRHQRADLIRKAILRQYEIISGTVKNPICCVYIYGEITELYLKGLLKLPDEFIRVWADNGYGKMVSRRQGNKNPRHPALPSKKDGGLHGLYYHITFHDLQASSHLTMTGLPPDMIADELRKSVDSGADSFLLVNCGNIRPHVYILDLTRKIWMNGSTGTEKHPEEFCRRFFPSAVPETLECYRDYSDSFIFFGDNPDERAGEEFYHHPLRALLGHWIKGEGLKTEESLTWATGNTGLKMQTDWFLKKCIGGLNKWSGLRNKCLNALKKLDDPEKIFFEDNILLQVILHESGCRGFIDFCRGYTAFLEGDYLASYLKVSESIRSYEEGLNSLKKAEHDKWRNFYRFDWLTNIRCTMYALETLRRYIRVFGDGPEYFKWYKNHIMPESERRIYLENTQRRTLTDDELAGLLFQNFGGKDL